MDIRLLEYFLAVAKCGTITKAAEQLHVTQPTISRQLMDLEENVGTPLMIRGKRQVTLTQISPELQLRYNQTVERLGPLAVETLMGNEPSACRVKLQPATYSDLKRRAEPIDECPYCHRILITEF